MFASEIVLFILYYYYYYSIICQAATCNVSFDFFSFSVLMCNQRYVLILCDIPEGKRVIFLLGRYLNLCLWTWFPKGLFIAAFL